MTTTLSTQKDGRSVDSLFRRAFDPEEMYPFPYRKLPHVYSTKTTTVHTQGDHFVVRKVAPHKLS